MRSRKSKPASQAAPEIVFEEKQPGALSALVEAVIAEVVVPAIVHAAPKIEAAPVKAQRLVKATRKRGRE